MAEAIKFTRIYRDGNNPPVHGCLENVGHGITPLPSRGICPVTQREIVLNKEGFCMAADCEKNYTTDTLLNYSREKYKEVFSIPD
jgi:hypothetical protein